MLAIRNILARQASTAAILLLYAMLITTLHDLVEMVLTLPLIGGVQT